MSNNISVSTLELLASKICHDLISPIGAVNNGIEILEEMGPDAGPDVTNLIAFSAGIASAKLKAFRLAYGAGGADGHHTLSDVYDAIQNIVGAESKFTQDWDPKSGIGPELPPTGLCKMTTALLLLLPDYMPRGGTLSVEETDDGVIHVKGAGQGAAFKEGTVPALLLETPQDQLEPHMAHAYITGLLAGHYGFKLSAESGEDFISLFMHLPS